MLATLLKLILQLIKHRLIPIEYLVLGAPKPNYRPICLSIDSKWCKRFGVDKNCKVSFLFLVLY